MNNTTKLRILMVCCLVPVVCAPFAGMSFISPGEIFATGSPDAEVFRRLRLPRTVAAFFAGAGLSVAGMLFQAMFRNPLATPFTLGISGGAAFGASLYVYLGAGAAFGVSGGIWAAPAGALLSMLLVWALTRSRGAFSTPVLLLSGVIINFFFSSLVMLLQYLSRADDSLRIMHWLMGSLAVPDIARVSDMVFVVLAGFVFVGRLAPALDLLSAGEELAASRGVEVGRVKLWVFLAASLMVGVIVSLAGPIGFVGMMVPHVCRRMLGRRHGLLLPGAFVLGGAFLVVCDLGARTLFAPAELPIGIITALLGGPFFLWVLFRGGGRGVML
ncbi:MAG: iron ABC transporter permease [Desulfovibrio sp.]|nr:iron ABC transporter permease [Desulfovibrio sp.]